MIIDPIDGSSNFEKQIPFYCTSIAVLKGAPSRAPATHWFGTSSTATPTTPRRAATRRRTAAK